MAHLEVDEETANNFREAVRSRYGKDSWGKIKLELKTALDNHANNIKTTKEI